MLYGLTPSAREAAARCVTLLGGRLLPDLAAGKLKKVLFCGTGALLSPTSTQQGLPIPGVCHAVSISGGR